MSLSTTQLDRARAAKEKAKEVFADVDHLSGIGLTRQAGRYAVKVLLTDPLERSDNVPDNIDGVPIVFQVVGKIRKQPNVPSKRDRAAVPPQQDRDP